MLFKNIVLGILSLCLVGTAVPSQAGMVSKAAKGYVAYKVVKKATPAVKNVLAKNKANKLARKTEKENLAKGPLINGELKIGKYGDMVDAKKTTKKLTDQKPTIGDASTRTQSHHLPSNAYMKKHGVSKEDGIAIEMQEARHGATRTYKGGNSRILKDNEAPRQALARDVKDFKDQYRHDPETYKKAKGATQEAIKQNKENYPQLFNKK